ncbi:hypothetical protein CEXT_528051 [Caerostris extrusa]|uniref:Uncharacterized protein n=1 Tax=Caerostris extrusa TaxID=172846 RepID=A0AAV4XJP0_CAEEX|nr:hypothetical protein CEXT_528051 [Caerostris extrusa]
MPKRDGSYLIVIQNHPHTNLEKPSNPIATYHTFLALIRFKDSEPSPILTVKRKGRLPKRSVRSLKDQEIQRALKSASNTSSLTKTSKRPKATTSTTRAATSFTFGYGEAEGPFLLYTWQPNLQGISSVLFILIQLSQ